MRSTNRVIIDLDVLAELFPRQVATSSELVRLGLSGDSIRTRCGQDGPWRLLLPGIVLLDSAEPTRGQLVQAALRHVGGDAILTGADAVRLHGFRSVDVGGPVDLLVPRRKQVRTTDLVRTQRTASLPEPRMRAGFPVAPLPRAVIDAARRMSTPEAIHALFGEVVTAGLVSTAMLRGVLDHGSRRGTSLSRRVLGEIDAGLRSAGEHAARELVIRGRVPQPRWRTHATDELGRPVCVVDAWWADQRVAWDIWAGVVDDLTAARLAAAGVLLVRTPPSRLRSEPGRVAAELNAVLHRPAAPRRRAMIGAAA